MCMSDQPRKSRTQNSNFAAVRQEYRDALAAVQTALAANDEARETEAYKAKDDAFDRLMLTPARAPWAIQEKFGLFEMEVLDTDDMGRLTSHREHVWFAALKADALCLAALLASTSCGHDDKRF
jgi:hypothetical protein